MVWSCGYASEFDMKHLKKAKECIGRNVVSITTRMKTIVQILWMNDKNYQALSQKFRQIIPLLIQNYHFMFSWFETSQERERERLKYSNKESGIFRGKCCSYINTNVWLHYLDFNETFREERYLHNPVCFFCKKKILKQHPTKQQLYGHLPPIS